MEFWGVEVKPKETVKCEAGDDKLLHLSQVSLGEFKKDKGSEKVPLFVKINDQKIVLGTLSPENCTQIQYDLVFEKDFELSHGSKDTSVFFIGYKSNPQDFDSEDDIYDSDSDEDLQIDQKMNEKAAVKSNQGKPTTGKAASSKDISVAVKAKPQKGKPDKVEKPKSDVSIKKDDEDDEDDDGDDDSEGDSDDDDEEMAKGLIDSDDEDDVDDEDDEDDESSEDDEANLKVENDKKRIADGALKLPAGKKVKVTTPAGKQKNDVKKSGKAATPQATKQSGKTPASAGKANQQTPKSAGAFKCNSCSKPFNSDNALQAHTKAKHPAK